MSANSYIKQAVAMLNQAESAYSAEIGGLEAQLIRDHARAGEAIATLQDQVNKLKIDRHDYESTRDYYKSEAESLLNENKELKARLERNIANARDEIGEVKLELMAANKNNERIRIERESALNSMHKAVYEKDVLEIKLNEVEHIKTEYEGMKHNLGLAHQDKLEAEARISAMQSAFKELYDRRRADFYTPEIMDKAYKIIIGGGI